MSFPLGDSQDKLFPSSVNIDPVSPVAKLESAIQGKIEASKAYDRINGLLSVPMAAPGSVPQNTDAIRAQLRTARESLTKAQNNESQYRKDATADIDKWFTEHLNGEVISKYYTKDAAGSPSINDGALKTDIDAYVRKLGGGSNVANMMFSEAKKRAVQSLYTPMAMEETQKELAKYGPGYTEKATKQMVELQGNIKMKMDAFADNLGKELKGKVAKLTAQYAPKFEELKQRSEHYFNEVLTQNVGDLEFEKNFAIDAKREELTQQVANGEIMPASAKFRLDQFASQANEDFNQYVQSKEFQDKVTQDYEDNYGFIIGQEFEQAHKEYASQVSSAKSDIESKYKRISKEVDGYWQEAVKKYESALPLLEQGDKMILERSAKKGWEKAYSKFTEENAKRTDLWIDGLPGPLQVTAGAKLKRMGEQLGRGFSSAYGGFVKGFGHMLEGMGLGGPLVDYFTYSGTDLVSENFLYEPSFGLANFVRPAWVAGEMGKLAGYMAPSIAAGMATGGGSLGVAAGALAGTLTTGATNADDTYWSYLDANPGDVAGASKAARNVFLGSMLVFPLEALTSKLIFGKKTLANVLRNATGEYVSEGYENAIQQTAVSKSNENVLTQVAKNWATKESQQAGITAFGNSLIMGGLASVSSRAMRTVSGQTNPGAQYIAGLIYDRSGDYAKATFAANKADYKDAEFNGIIQSVDRISEAVKDAKEMGMDKATAMRYVELSENVAMEKSKKISNPAMKLLQDKRVKALEDEMGKLMDGNTKLTTVSIMGTPVAAIEDKEAGKLIGAPAIQEAVQLGVITVESGDTDVNGALEKVVTTPTELREDNPVVDVVLANDDDINTETKVGQEVENLLSSGAPEEQVTAAVVQAVLQDEAAAEQALGADIVHAAKMELAASLRAESEAAKVEQAEDTQTGITGEQAQANPEIATPEGVQDGVVIEEATPTVAETETVAPEVIKPAKPEMKLNLIPSKDLVKDTKNRVENKAKHDAIKKEYKELVKLVNCLTS